MASPFSIYFRGHPKDSVPLYDDYLQIIKNPMWLREVLDRLHRSAYVYVHEWVNDMMSIWENAINYNAPDSTGHDLAVILREMFESKCLPVPNSEADMALIEKETIMRKIKRHIANPPDSIRSLSWEVARIADSQGDDMEVIPWTEPTPIVAERIRAILGSIV